MTEFRELEARVEEMEAKRQELWMRIDKTLDMIPDPRMREEFFAHEYADTMKQLEGELDRIYRELNRLAGLRQVQELLKTFSGRQALIDAGGPKVIEEGVSLAASGGGGLGRGFVVVQPGEGILMRAVMGGKAAASKDARKNKSNPKGDKSDEEV